MGYSKSMYRKILPWVLPIVPAGLMCGFFGHDRYSTYGWFALFFVIFAVYGVILAKLVQGFNKE
jgi:hypothetical protein